MALLLQQIRANPQKKKNNNNNFTWKKWFYGVDSVAFVNEMYNKFYDMFIYFLYRVSKKP